MAGTQSYDSEEQGNIMKIVIKNKEIQDMADGQITSLMIQINWWFQENKIQPFLR